MLNRSKKTKQNKPKPSLLNFFLRYLGFFMGSVLFVHPDKEREAKSFYAIYFPITPGDFW